MSAVNIYNHVIINSLYMLSPMCQLAFKVLYKYQLRESSWNHYEAKYYYDPSFKMKNQCTERLSNQPESTELRRGEHRSESQVF